mgnify:CR=1 FL=1
MLTAIWIFVIALLGLWSLTSWGLYTLLSLDNQWLGELRPLLERVPFADWLDRWVPGWQALAELSIDAVQVALGALGTAAPVVVWVVWGVGTLVLTGIGVVLSLLVALLRDDKPAAPGTGSAGA